MSSPASTRSLTPRDSTRSRELEEAFRAFNETSMQLEGAYRELEGRAATLSAELAEARSERLAQLAEKERLADRLAGLHETLPGGFIVLDGDGCVQEHNAGATELLGAALEGRCWDAVAEACFVDGDSGGTELALRDGRRLSVASRALVAEPGRIILLTDVTETRRLQALLARNERLTEMGEMTARLAHQIRTPLAAAILYASQLDDDVGRAPAGFVAKLLARLHHLEHMVNDMLSFARGSSASIERIPLAALLADTAQTLEPQLPPEAGITVVAPAASLAVHGNREALAGALLNLANNAVEAAGVAAQLTLRASAIDVAHVEIEVRDNGPGVPEALCEKIFQPFFTTRSAGTGLGLAVVRSVARAHGGTVSVAAGPQGGAVFSMKLPLRCARPAPLSSGPAAERHGPAAADSGSTQ